MPKVTADVRKEALESAQSATGALIRALDAIHTAEVGASLKNSESSAMVGSELALARKHIRTAAQSLEFADKKWRTLVAQSRKA